MCHTCTIGTPITNRVNKNSSGFTLSCAQLSSCQIKTFQLNAMRYVATARPLSSADICQSPLKRWRLVVPVADPQETLNGSQTTRISSEDTGNRSNIVSMSLFQLYEFFKTKCLSSSTIYHIFIFKKSFSYSDHVHQIFNYRVISDS